MTSIHITLTDNDGIHSELAGLRKEDHPVVVLMLTRAEIERGKTGSAVDRLMVLTDSESNVRRLDGALALMVTGYDSDPRELYEIPECVRFFRDITTQWNAWLHFIETRAGSLGVLLRLLIDTRVEERDGVRVGVSFVNPVQADFVMAHLFRGAQELHTSYKFSAAESEAIRARVMSALDGGQ